MATVRDPARREAVAALGADAVVGPAEAAAHGPYDVVLELVGAASLTGTRGQRHRALATGARIMVIGVGGGSTVEVNLLALMGARAWIGGATLRGRDRAEKAAVAAAVAAHAVPLLGAGRVRVPVCATFPMAEADAAYGRFAAGAKLGKVVLVP